MIRGREDQEKLQSDLQVLYKWAEINNMGYNDKKFEKLSFGESDGTREYTAPTGISIEEKQWVRDLGVYVDGKCTFDEHIKHVVKSSQQVSAWILRTFICREKKLLKVLLKSLLIPHTEYACVVWSPFDNKRINMIESTQRKFTSKIAEYQKWDEEAKSYVCAVNYWDRLKDLGAYSLERRRERFFILYAYRVVIGLIRFHWFEAYVERGIKLRAKYNNRATQFTKRRRFSSFFYKAPQLYNLLPVELRQEEHLINPHQINVNEFKVKLDKFLEKIPDQPTTPGLHRAATSNSLICQIPLYRRNQMFPHANR